MGTKSTLIETEPLLVSAATRRFTDDLPAIELWDAWVFAEVETDLALEAWYSAPRDEKRGPYAAYVAALDREEQAALTLERRLARP
ncbi:MAG TPA: hypothetical protein VGI67_15670 [Thermoleophilaceae bacterium]|jgi:hypothetical protein